ncbi:TPA: hypothetical protein DDW35_13205 [Candidatus Sumerlaeota bacterium]|nr:hypothetical protein [Candidatus Sumerlaeota bacterium]
MNMFQWKTSAAAVVCAGILLCMVGCGKKESEKNASESTNAKAQQQTALTSATQAKATPPLREQVTFNLKYRGWDINEKGMFNGNSWGGNTETTAKTSFTQELKLDAAKVFYPGLPNYSGQQGDYTALECDAEGNAKALYIDLNDNGKLDEGEKILPSVPTTEMYRGDKRVFFITPDFEIYRDGKLYPCRMAANTQTQKQHMTRNGVTTEELYTYVNWSVASCLEGSATINGQEYRLMLYDTTPGTANYTSFGTPQNGNASTFSLFKPAAVNKQGGYISRQSLTRMIMVEGAYYEMRFSDDLQKLILTPSTLPLSSLSLTVNAPSEVKTRNVSVVVRGVEDKNLTFSFSAQENKSLDLPAMPYKICGGGYEYWPASVENPDKNQETRKNLWRANIRESNTLAVPPNEVVFIDFGQPTLSIAAAKRDNDYYRQDTALTTRTVFRKGDPVVLICTVQGKMGEVYESFQHNNDYNNSRPTYQITDTSGTLITSSTLNNYAQRGGSAVYEWNTQGVPAGKYTVSMQMETGPLAGKLEGTLEITLERSRGTAPAGTPVMWK